MSTVNISYSSLNHAASKATEVANKLTNYADSLNGSVYEKLSSYSGTFTSNISGAKSSTNTKISDLRDKADAYKKYANDLAELKGTCESVDNSVMEKVSSLTAAFKSANGINSSKAADSINYFLTSLGNSTATGRWLSNLASKGKSAKDYIGQRIKDWWNYEGGKQRITSRVKDIISVALAVVTVAALVVSGAGVVVLAAGVVLGVLEVANSIVDDCNETKAYEATRNGDPALGRQRSNINTLSEGMRKDTDSSFWHNMATALDITEFACEVVLLTDNVKGVAKNAKTWITGIINGTGTAKPFSNIQDIGVAIKDSISEGSIDSLKTAVGNSLKDFGKNLESNFLDFTDTEHELSSMKHSLSFARDIFNDGLTVKNIANDVVFPSVVAVDLKEDDGNIGLDTTKIMLGDLTSIINKTNKQFEDAKKSFKTEKISLDFELDKDILEELSQISEVNISVPETHFPEIDLYALRAA